MGTIPYGYCHCGCGNKAPISARTSTAQGYVKGEPRKYVNGHQARRYRDEYTITDCGYETPCWISNKSPDTNGYTYDRKGGRSIGLHRLYYERELGPIDPGKELHHLCFQPKCCNPDHLQPVTRAEHARLRSDLKLTPEVETRIASALSDLGRGYQEIGAEFGVSRDTVIVVWNRHFSCSRNRKNQRVFSDDVATMKALYADGLSQKRIAERFGISSSLVSLYVRGKRQAPDRTA